MNLNNLVNGLIQITCQHTQTRLQRRSAPKSSSSKPFSIGLPGSKPLISISSNQPSYIYRCPTCKQDLPVALNAQWEKLYNSFRPANPSPSPSNVQFVTIADKGQWAKCP